MARKQDTAVITAAAERHILSYCADLTSPVYQTSTQRAAKLATYYLPSISILTDGTMTRLSDPSQYAELIAGPLDKVGSLPRVGGHRIDAISENSAIIWLFLEVNGMEISNVYFFRNMGNGVEGFEGGFLTMIQDSRVVKEAVGAEKAEILTILG
ncbi:hypothetical protein BO83DRAFT_434222 [Aspergillus eucalypticola CBS 122712]|uniref:SnoaL-like domain-containing protein n=1 Tax=Aspergillus eucalypticola (strain CBS 122712 / IBT 29274) TaxID=1448314 RepID=A0A317W9I8_ASPEC|nr:uncharacterized protein BO83DRAFT_434222 [Aspergillus eucalypticola CBS 122712]PWY82585.1 hypothetical protein BO83DRAFT_434222 [Aspergillus eucalypticola CBS 122712]